VIAGGAISVVFAVPAGIGHYVVCLAGSANLWNWSASILNAVISASGLDMVAISSVMAHCAVHLNLLKRSVEVKLELPELK
jgi:acyl-CoA hydrolase